VSGVGLLAFQLRTDLVRFWRNPQSRYLTLLLPVVLLLIFAAIFKGKTITDGQVINTRTFYVPAIMTFGIISASYVNLACALVSQRERGELKRLRGTPLSASFLIASRLVINLLVAVAIAALLLVIGRLAYGVKIPGSTGVGMIIAVIVGAASFACIGYGVSTLISSEDSAVPATNVSILPLYFISGVFIPEHQIPAFLSTIAKVFPAYHLSHALLHTFTQTHGLGISAVDILVMAAWGIAALLLTLLRFQWSPRTGE